MPAPGPPAITPQPPLAEIRQLLERCALPVGDLPSVHGDATQFFGTLEGNRLYAVVGLETCSADVLLRSLAVADEARGRGLGAALVAHAERTAAARGARAIYLLTETAEAFFARRGYRELARGEAPAAVRATREFRGLCPASATFMYKPLTG